MMMSERKEKTMLKWLKQKQPSSSSSHGIGNGGLPIEKITDDPLATIQVHPQANKKNKNKANEIYAVSRVNPLFEEELEVKEVFSPGGHSGSSGYDSGSGPSDDDFPILHSNLADLAADLKDLSQGNLFGRLSASSAGTTALAAATANGPHLFINTENDVIHHETAIVGPNGRPILQILEQNPAYVKSIALAVPGSGRKRPLSPISEQNHVIPLPPAPVQSPPPTLSTKYNLSTSGSLYNKDAKLHSNKNSNNNNYTTIDSIGSARLLKKDSQYVRSIRIGGAGPTNFTGNPTKRSILEANSRRYSSTSSSASSTTGAGGVTRRPSVTFADDVGVGRSSGSRKPSMDQDSIVTESLLMMTSGGGVGVGADHPLTRRFSNASQMSSSSGIATNSTSRKTSVSSSSAATASSHDAVDLEAFANSLRKSRPIKHITSGRTLDATAAAEVLELDDTASSSAASSSSNNPRSSTEDFGDVDDSQSPEASPSTANNDRRTATLDRPMSPSAIQAQNSSASPTPRIHHSKSHKSPFGGIADHYAAAKEIAKEIESYSNGSAKASTKKSLVRDLLYRGNRNTSTLASASGSNNNPYDNAIKKGQNGSSSYETSGKNPGFRTASRDEREGTASRRELHVKLAARTSSPYYDNSTGGAYGGSAVKNSSSSNNSGTNRRNGGGGTGGNPGANNPKTLYGSAVAAAAAAGGQGNGSSSSNDWELVRVQQVYVKDLASPSSSQDQLVLSQKQRKSGDSIANIIAADSLSSSSRALVHHQGQDHIASAASTIAISTNSRRHHHHHLQQQQLQQQYPSSSSASRGKAAKNNKAMTVDHLTVDYYLKKGCYPHHLTNESERYYRRLSDNSSSGVSSGYDESASSDTSEGPDHITDVSVSSRSTTPSLVPSAADDGLPAAATGARSHNIRIQNEDTDSGNSSDRTYAEVRLEIEGAPIKLEICPADISSSSSSSDNRIQVVEDDDIPPGNLPSKVMIVTGDSQNIVVDLSGVPLDLKNAIVSGTALITLPDGLDTMLQPGYTMITIPATHSNNANSSSASSSSRSPIPRAVHSQEIAGDGGGGKRGGAMNITIGLDDDKPLVTSRGSGSDDECKLFAKKNKAQIWDVIQQGGDPSGGDGGDRGSKSKKKITTIFPFHPNQDTYESPDFTIEGHRMDRQRKKVELEKKRRCVCRLCGMLVFLIAFLGVLVALSMIYTRGQRYFGSV